MRETSIVDGTYGVDRCLKEAPSRAQNVFELVRGLFDSLSSLSNYTWKKKQFDPPNFPAPVPTRQQPKQRDNLLPALYQQQQPQQLAAERDKGAIKIKSHGDIAVATAGRHARSVHRLCYFLSLFLFVSQSPPLFPLYSIYLQYQQLNLICLDIVTLSDVPPPSYYYHHNSRSEKATRDKR